MLDHGGGAPCLSGEAATFPGPWSNQSRTSAAPYVPPRTWQPSATLGHLELSNIPTMQGHRCPSVTHLEQVAHTR